MLRGTFSIIVLESLRRITRWVVFAFCLACQHHTITPAILETPRTSGIPVRMPANWDRQHSPGASGYSLITPRMHLRDYLTFYFYANAGAACDVSAYDWGRSQSVVLTKGRLVLRSRALILSSTHTVRGGMSYWPPIASRFLFVSVPDLSLNQLT